MKDGKFLTMAIESSCDETAIAVVADGRTVLSNVISSQIDIFKQYGGVVPEIASRHHLENINGVLQQALDEAGVSLAEIDLIGVTYGPGLIGALLVGVATAKAVAFAKDIPLVGVHHLLGHISANYIQDPALKPPFMALITSGGHTEIVDVQSYTHCELLGLSLIHIFIGLCGNDTKAQGCRCGGCIFGGFPGGRQGVSDTGRSERSALYAVFRLSLIHI